MNKEQFVEWFCSKRKCKSSSGVTQFYNMKRIRKILGLSDKIQKTHTWIPNDPKKILKFEQANVQRNLSTSVVTFLKALGNAPEKKKNLWVDLMNEHARKVDLIYQSNEKTKKQKDNWIDQKMVTRFMREKTKHLDELDLFAKKEWTFNDRRLAQEALILTLHASSPPRLELSQLIYVTSDKDMNSEENYLIKRPRKGWFVQINVGKTASRRPSAFKLSLPSTKLLNKMRRFLTPGEPVFISRSGTRLSRNSYGKLIKRMFKTRYGKNVTASLLRTIFVSDKWKDLPKYEEIKKTADKMMHSVSTHLGKYKKK